MAIDIGEELRRSGSAVFGRGLRVAAWTLAHFALGFAQQVIEVIAPFLLACGIGWWALPEVLRMVAPNSQTEAPLNDVLAHFPQTLEFGGHLISALDLVVDGLLLMALAALLQTLAALIGNEIIDR